MLCSCILLLHSIAVVVLDHRAGWSTINKQVCISVRTRRWILCGYFLQHVRSTKNNRMHVLCRRWWRHTREGWNFYTRRHRSYNVQYIEYPSSMSYRSLVIPPSRPFHPCWANETVSTTFRPRLVTKHTKYHHHQRMTGGRTATRSKPCCWEWQQQGRQQRRRDDMVRGGTIITNCIESANKIEWNWFDLQRFTWGIFGWIFVSNGG